jgi:hypothetical protein
MTMLFRSLTLSTVLAGYVAAGAAGPVSTQIILCPDLPPASSASSDILAETERLLHRLTIALDLDGYRGISSDDITELHTETPSALLAKLSNVVDRCTKASLDLTTFHDALPELREAFLEATGISFEAIEEEGSDIKTVALQSDDAVTEDELNVRDLWRKLWFRSVEDVDPTIDRWAVIVASPSDIDSGWDKLGEHQRRWRDSYFQLHVPYYDSNPHHAIVVGRRLPHDQALRLREYAIELGMAEDSYVWPLPIDGAEETTTPVDVDAAAGSSARRDVEGGLDLSILDR